MSTLAGRRRNGLRIVDLMALVAATAVALWALTGSWTRGRMVLEIWVEETRPGEARAEWMSDEVIATACRTLNDPRRFSSPEALRSVLTVGETQPYGRIFLVDTGDQAVNRAVFQNLLAAYHRCVHHPRAGPHVVGPVLSSGNLELPPELLGRATPWVVCLLLMGSGGVFLWVLRRAWSFREEACGPPVEPHAGAG
jgi:hypothetical protein